MHRTLITPNESIRLAEVIGEMESKTSGELRLMIVQRSTRPANITPMLWLALTSFALITIWEARHWLYVDDQPVLLTEPWWLLPLIVLACGGLAIALAAIPFVRKLLISKAEIEDAVRTRAELEFYREGLHKTAGGTGILLFLSLYERHAVVLGDSGINSKLNPETWGEVVKLITAGNKNGDWAEQLEKAIRRCGRLLAEHFPIQPGDKNELPNHVVIKD